MPLSDYTLLPKCFVRLIQLFVVSVMDLHIQVAPSMPKPINTCYPHLIITFLFELILC
uniref:Uncharacterized protein n=1 Tax=Arundo donax TaxID=35708 RepID=A0A0A9EPK6_ARUDO